MAARAATSTEFVIKAPKLEYVVVTIEGLTPLIRNPWTDKGIEEMEWTQFGGVPRPREFRDREQEYLSRITKDQDGDYIFPSTGIKKALVAAGGRFADSKMTELRGLFSIPDENVKFQAKQVRRRRDVGVLRNGAPQTIYRPEFSGWTMRVPVLYNTGLLSRDQLVNLFLLAGTSVGIGAWRPERSGPFGQFKPTKVEE